MNRSSAWIQSGIFLLFILVFFALNIITPDRTFSDRENRSLEQAPKIDLSSLLNGEFTSDLAAYTTDQFVLRDTWTTLRARSELAFGKQENNGVYLCEGGILLEEYKLPEDKQIDANLFAIESLVANAGVPVYLALVPGAAEILSDVLPKNAPCDSQMELIQQIYSATSAETIDMYSALFPHKDEYIFYRTDHHWTSLGAYYGYTALMDAMNMPSLSLDSFQRHIVSEDFFGTIYSTSGMSWVEPDVVETFVQPSENLKILRFPEGEAVEGTLYNMSFLAKKDKYATFLGGNVPLVRITTGQIGAPSLLIIRDSYMDCQVPFLLDSFSEIHMIDLRYYKLSLKDYIDTNDVDSILICYSINTFSTDSSIFLMAY